MKMKSLDDLAREYENNMRYKQARPAQAKNEPVSPADLRFWTRFNDTLTWIKAERGQLQKYLDNKSYEFGAVVATSGLTSRQQEPRFSQVSSPLVFLDWALVRMRVNRRPGENKINILAPDNRISTKHVRLFLVSMSI
ncbi:hypothetical protein BO86DRAFT_402754 [Aspergillus japonicus CBS 114.51]|uniref:Uncharacterized protein n=1 Tax=Aspergillus japonicus CBS 114.51 TaxID=1448312 RepID=A0A8T8WT44_ASPJA|nr:hypothetical protein BO86DRAFT_402754 [Aspergillus japonicus CBS 114.51]RAH78509.1 hypothetical protein BO86DRAFT_402754 [Aspergillus japonicus CBS 114.51]